MTSLEFQHLHLTAHPLLMSVVGMSVVGLQQFGPTAIGNRFIGDEMEEQLPFLAQEDNFAITDEDTGEELELG